MSDVMGEVRRIAGRSGILGALFAAAAIVAPAMAQTTPTTTTSTPTTTTGTTASGAGGNSVVNLGSTGQVLFVALIIGVFAALWFTLILYDRVSTNRRVDKLLPVLVASVQSTEKGAPLTAAQIRAIGTAVAPRGATGLTRTTIALGLLTLVGVALAALLVGDGRAASDLLKTVVTALTTALTTVLGFYFGARTATDAAEAGGGAGGAAGPGEPSSAPDAPTNVSAAPADGQATVSFSAPPGTGGSPITGYVVTSTPGGITAEGASSPIVVAGLDNGVTYSFTVRATNALGSSQESSPSRPVTPGP
jgi:hypothetical protein